MATTRSLVDGTRSGATGTLASVGTGSFEGWVIGCPATVSPDDDAFHIRLDMQWSLVEEVRITGDRVLVRSGKNMIWFQSDDAEAAYRAIAQVAPPAALDANASASNSASTAPPRARRWLRRG